MLIRNAYIDVNNAIWHWDMYLLNGGGGHLTEADRLMKKYRRHGGEMYQETEKKIREAVKAREEKSDG